jgi:hypothetical protein
MNDTDASTGVQPSTPAVTRLTALATVDEARRHPDAAVRQPSQRALATRSLSAALRLTGEARREALREHFERFVPSMNRSCPSHR